MEKNWYKRLKESRIKNNIKLKEAAEVAQLSIQGLNDYETNRNNISPRVEVLERLCELYNVSLLYILYGNDAGLKLDNDLKTEITAILSLYIYKKCTLEKDINDKFVIKINDHWLNFYLKYFKEAIDKNIKSNLNELADIIKSINNIKDK